MTRKDFTAATAELRRERPETAITRIAAAYLRRSAATTENPGNDSREAQEAAVKRLCGPDVALYVDWGISGSGRSTAKREAYVSLKADIEAGRIGSVCAYSLTRLGRSAQELLAFVNLCRDHDVTIRTATENIDTSTAAGRAMLGILAVFAEFELESGRERSAAARQARIARHEAAGLDLLGSKAIYGFRHVTTDGLTREERDTEPLPETGQDRIDTVLEAFREAGSIRGACVLLNARSVPSPEGSTWGHSTLRRLLLDYQDRGLVVVQSRKRVGRPTGGKALLAGLLKCHCGRTLTPNVGRKDARSGKPLPPQYYCAGGRDLGRETHGQYSVAESRVLPAVQAEEAKYVTQVRRYRRAAEDVQARIDQAQAQRARLEDVYMDPNSRMTVAQYRERTAALDQEADRLQAQTRNIALDLPQYRPEWDQTELMNRHLRRLFTEVRLDQGMNVAKIDRALPDAMFEEPEA